MASRTDLVRRPTPAVRSAGLVRAIASGLTLLSFGAMTYFAAGNLHQTAAPLKPAAPAAAATTRPTPTAQPFSRSGRTFVSPTVPSTSRTPTTRTRQSG